MTNRELCLKLIHADSEEEVIDILQNAGFWNRPDVWRNYGDVENNYSSAGNQSSRPEAALVEKLTNARDARLMNACLERDIDPEGPDAPTSLKEAVAAFFEENSGSEIAGHIEEWSNQKRREVAKGITLASTGAMAKEDRNYCLTVADCGEGQTPKRMPHTLLSLKESIKMRIPFVHGRFNMGGTAALRFCGEHNFQLILCRRNPALVGAHPENASDLDWGFTIVRREYPEGNRVSSVYTYLAPVNAEAEPGHGGILHFSAESMPIFPEGQNAYARESEWGTLIKLYEYKTRSSSQIVGGKSSLLYSLAVRLPNIGLPVRMYECRPSFKGHGGSHETTLSGLEVRLHDDGGNNLEEGYPTFHPMNVDGNKLRIGVYAFKEDKAYTYRNAREGILFTLNGQTQGILHDRFFVRKSVKKSYLKKSLLVIVDCSDFSDRAVEEFFMNSRDRLSTGELREKIEERLAHLLKNHEGLRALQERRRREKKKEKLGDERPLEQVLNSLIKKSPTLAKLFLDGKRLPNPFKSEHVKDEEEPYNGQRFPTYFKFRKVNYGEILERNCHINKRSRIYFETDATNDYFGRNTEPGEFNLYLTNGERRASVENYTLNLHNGTATLNLTLPSNCNVGDELHYVAETTDSTRIANPPFENHFLLHVKKATKSSTNGGGRRKNPPGDQKGDISSTPSGLRLPDVTEVYESPDINQVSWDEVPLSPFDKYSALRVMNTGENNEEASDAYDFFINMDNLFLNTEIKSSKEDEEVIASQFKYGMVLLGLSLLYRDQDTTANGQSSSKTEDELVDDHDHEQALSVEEKIEEFTTAAAMVLLPAINDLGSLDLEDKLVNVG